MFLLDFIRILRFVKIHLEVFFILKSLHGNVKTLQRIVSRKGSSKTLSFGEPHVLKALQLLNRDLYVSRKSFCKSLNMGEGAVKTLLLHLKKEGLVDSVRAGSFLTKNGIKFVNELLRMIPSECFLGSSNVTQSKNNYAILLRNLRSQIRSGLEQRDAAILYGATSTITMIFQKSKFVFPGEEKDCLLSDKNMRKNLLEKLNPKEGDVIIVASANDPFSAELSVKNSALLTISN